LAETAFERAVRLAKQTNINQSDINSVALLLRNAGVEPTKVQQLLANPATVALIKANPNLVATYAKQFPANYVIEYEEARTQAGFGDPVEITFTSGGPDAMARNLIEKTGRTSPTGAQEFPGGVIVMNGQVFYPPTDASVAGSAAWMSQIPKWSQEKQQTWAKTLFQMGYLESKNANLKDLTDALKTYHDTRYIYGGGEPVDLSSGDAGITRKDFGGILDDAVLASDIETWYEDLYGDRPEKEELSYWTEKFRTTALRTARKQNLAPADAAMVAQARTQQRFRDTPEAREFERQEDEMEENTRLRDGLLSAAQIIGGV
jgi:hypothetical protein